MCDKNNEFDHHGEKGNGQVNKGPDDSNRVKADHNEALNKKIPPKGERNSEQCASYNNTGDDQNSSGEKNADREAFLQRILENPKLKMNDKKQQELRTLALENGENGRCPKMLVEIDPPVVDGLNPSVVETNEDITDDQTNEDLDDEGTGGDDEEVAANTKKISSGLPGALEGCEKKKPIPNMGYIAVLEPTLGELEEILNSPHVLSVETSVDLELW